MVRNLQILMKSWPQRILLVQLNCLKIFQVSIINVRLLEEFMYAFDYVMQLKFDEEPDYSLLIKYFSSIVVNGRPRIRPVAKAS